MSKITLHPPLLTTSHSGVETIPRESEAAKRAETRAAPPDRWATARRDVGEGADSLEGISEITDISINKNKETISNSKFCTDIFVRVRVWGGGGGAQYTEWSFSRNQIPMKNSC